MHCGCALNLQHGFNFITAITPMPVRAWTRVRGVGDGGIGS
jgi:hypothetical protein